MHEGTTVGGVCLLRWPTDCVQMAAESGHDSTAKGSAVDQEVVRSGPFAATFLSLI